MLERNKTILDAAAQVFTRYGVKRTTMNDIAAEAKVARQTLYNAFSNKDAILRALIDSHVNETCSSLEAHVKIGGPLDDGLELAFDHFARKPYMLIRNTPHGGEIMEALEDAASEEMAASMKRFASVMVGLLAPHTTDDPGDAFSATSLAEFIVYTSVGHKAKATSAEHLEQLLKTLKAVVLEIIR